MLTDIAIPESSVLGFEGAVNISAVTWAVFVIALIGTIIYGGIIIYHWFKYDYDTPMIWPTMIVYLSVSFLLILTIFFAAVNIT